jgi:hypothetical protein
MKMMKPMKDIHIRAALKRKLAAFYQGDSETLVVEEMGLRDGAARIDVAVISESLHGFELKSDSDRLDRLPRQCVAYGAIFDRMTLVVGPRLHNEAMKLIPSWWGVELAERTSAGQITFQTLRTAEENQSVDSLSIAKLLWREEALALLIELGHAKGVLSKPRARIHARLAEVSDLTFLRYRVRDRLRNRAAWRFDAPQQ